MTRSSEATGPDPVLGDAPEVLTMGRSGVDLYPLQSGVGLEDVTSFGKFLGGSPTNVAVAARRLGHPSAVVTGVGGDPFGRFVRSELRRFGVDDRHVVTFDDLITPVTFCELFPPHDFPLWFHRPHGSTPDLLLEPPSLDPATVRGARLLWLSATGLSTDASRATHLAALELRGDVGTTVLDLDHRPSFWPDEATARERVRAVLPRVDIAVGNAEECRVAVGETDPDAAAAALLATGVSVAVVKLGPEGVLARSAEERVEVPATRVPVVNGLGAGDAFGGALCHGLLLGWPLARTLTFASAAGAVVASRLGCAAAMPTEAEVEALLGGRS